MNKSIAALGLCIGGVMAVASLIAYLIALPFILITALIQVALSRHVD